VHSCKVFDAELTIHEAFASAYFNIISVGLDDLMWTGARSLLWEEQGKCDQAHLGGVAVRQAPEPGPTRGDRVSSSTCLYAPRRPFAGRRGEVVHGSHRAGRESWIPH
jgi:hypothetical protein